MPGVTAATRSHTVVGPDGVHAFRGQDTRERRNLILVRPGAPEVVPDRAHRRPHLLHRRTNPNLPIHPSPHAKRTSLRRSKLTHHPRAHTALRLTSRHTAPFYAVSLRSRSSDHDGRVSTKPTRRRPGGAGGGGGPSRDPCSQRCPRAKASDFIADGRSSRIPGGTPAPPPRPAASTRS